MHFIGIDISITGIVCRRTTIETTTVRFLFYRSRATIPKISWKKSNNEERRERIEKVGSQAGILEQNKTKKEKFVFFFSLSVSLSSFSLFLYRVFLPFLFEFVNDIFDLQKI